MLNRLIITKVRDAFVKNCIILVGNAYDTLRASGVVNHDMDENTVSENLRRLMRQNSNGIVIAREQPMDDGRLLSADKKADALPRIDFQFEWSWTIPQHQFVFCMEAKNLYANDFMKTGRRKKTSAVYYHKRYVETGISHLLRGYYPPDTYLLGYVLEGSELNAIMGVNTQVSAILSPVEILSPVQPLFPSLKTYTSHHNQGVEIKHLMLQF